MDAKGYAKKALWIAIPVTVFFIVYLIASKADGCVSLDGDKKLADATINDLVWVLLIFAVLWSALRPSK